MPTLDEFAAKIEDAIVGSLDSAQIATQLQKHTNGTVDQLLTATLLIARKRRRFIATLERAFDDALTDRDNLETEIQDSKSASSVTATCLTLCIGLSGATTNE